jgi:hypothetical protein
LLTLVASCDGLAIKEIEKDIHMDNFFKNNNVRK